MNYYVMKDWSVELHETPPEHGRRINPFLALALAPILGGLFVVYMPFMGFWMVGRALWDRVRA